MDFSNKKSKNKIAQNKINKVYKKIRLKLVKKQNNRSANN